MSQPQIQTCVLKKGSKSLEVICKLGTVNKFREGKLGIDNVIVSEEIFKNHQKMERASEDEIADVVGTLRGLDAVKEILMKGEIALTTLERREKVEQKRKEILNFIHSYYSDPTNGLPIPITRLETAWESFRYVVDPFKAVEDQVIEVVDQMKGILPLKKNVITGDLQIPHKYLGQCQGIIKKYSDKGREKYDHQGLTVEIEVIPGNFDKLMQELSKVTSGEHQFSFTGGSKAPQPVNANEQQDKHGKKGQGNKRGGKK
ncbi:MAG: putative rRNA metabolism protein, SBDS family [Streblomastix strix]|uniref:Putative rRNA metabolism protein, SBDS family n=1 Tax=Streblomastix strix TaxID=222440 RepID=A0A5J4W234_9EUKA|nr:MAG: putative rRNA metabolism protein, SBDS family [Streblomastix strix]